MKKIIATKQIKRWQKLDRLALGVPLIMFILLSIGEQGRLIWGVILEEKNLAITAASLLLLALGSAVVSLPVILIWRAISHSVKKAAIRNATFRTDEDFDYYREKLTGIPPTTISLLMDLQIEPKKDMAALLLKYVKMGAVSMEGGEVQVLNQELLGLYPSDRMLLTLLEKKQVQPPNLSPWKRQVLKEAVESGNLKYRGAQQNIHSVSHSCLTGCLSGCLLPILILVGIGIIAFKLQDSGWMDMTNAYLEAAPQSFGIEQLKYILEMPDAGLVVGLAAFYSIALFAMLLLPVAAVLRTVLSAANAVIWLKRTEDGEILTAQISGLKNFIRDFSNLSEAEKEQLILWDDFLIYAVVLEENQRIIEDIFSMKNLRYQDFKLF